jgi:hypothetical protein
MIQQEDQMERRRQRLGQKIFAWSLTKLDVIWDLGKWE